MFSKEDRDLAIPSAALRVLLLTDFLVLLGELGALVIMPWWIISEGGARAMALYGIVVAIATVIGTLAVSPFGDRWCKASQIKWGLAVQIVVAAGLLQLAMSGVFSLPHLVSLAVVQVVANAFVDPARSTILAELVHPDQLPVAIRVRKTCQAIGGIVGPIVAGLALSTMGLRGSLCVYAGILLCAWACSVMVPKCTMGDLPRANFARWWRELQAGMAAKWCVPMERGWTLVNFIVWIFQGPAVGILIPIKVHSLDLDGGWLGASLGALSSGVLLGSAFGSQWLVHVFGRYRVRLALGLFEGISFAVVGFVSSPYIMVAALALAGFCNASMALVGATHRALAIPRAYRVRMLAASSMTTQLAGALGPALVGMALTKWSVNLVYTAFGLLMATSVLGFLFVPRLREFLGLGHEQIVDWYRHQYPAVFR